ncbi:hypothetical protein ON010_g3911 [Phytophthora cinnamomi]|nr:hypothetical protein ON010_g3911 [Phytophthora cinnamomi]
MNRNNEHNTERTADATNDKHLRLPALRSHPALPRRTAAPLHRIGDHLGVATADRFVPQQRQHPRADGGRAQRPSHAGALGVADAVQLLRRDAGLGQRRPHDAHHVVLVMPGRLARQEALARRGDVRLARVRQDLRLAVCAVADDAYAQLVGAALDAHGEHVAVLAHRRRHYQLLVQMKNLSHGVLKRRQYAIWEGCLKLRPFKARRSVGGYDEVVGGDVHGVRRALLGRGRPRRLQPVPGAGDGDAAHDAVVHGALQHVPAGREQAQPEAGRRCGGSVQAGEHHIGQRVQDGDREQHQSRHAGAASAAHGLPRGFAHGEGGQHSCSYGYVPLLFEDDERAQIVEEYNSGQFYGSKLAIGIFDAPGEPLESDSKATAPRTPTAVVAASVTALFCLGLVLHQRRRYQNGYAPIYLTKGGHVQGKKSPTSKGAPEERSLRPDDAAGSSAGGHTFKQEANERFAV